MVKVLVIGLDGGTWRVIKPLVSSGKMPTISFLMKNGCFGDLESSIPAVTFPAWKCYSTGKNPGKLGVYWFLEPNFKEKRFIIHNSYSFKSLELWDYLSIFNITSCIIDMPTTYPPKKIKGVMIANSNLGKAYTYPPSVEKELRTKFDYKPYPDYDYSTNKDVAVKECMNIIKQRFEVAKYLIQSYSPSFLHLTICATDNIQHTFWRFMREKNSKYGEVIAHIWELIDEGIKTLLEILKDDEYYIFLISDHGFISIKATFQLAKWLQENGLLVLKQSSLFKKVLKKLCFTRGNVLRLLEKMKLYSAIIHIFPRDVLIRTSRFFPKETVDKSDMIGMVDWERSLVVPLPQGLLYINKTKFGSRKEYEKFRNILIQKIRNLRNPFNGDNLAKAVYEAEKIYHGPFAYKAPDIVIVPNKGYNLSCSIIANAIWERSYFGDWSGTHESKGIFLCSGPKIKKGKELKGNIKIYDIAPTILYIFGCPIPPDIDGKPLEKIFEGQVRTTKKGILSSKKKEMIRYKIRLFKSYIKKRK